MVGSVLGSGLSGCLSTGLGGAVSVEGFLMVWLFVKNSFIVGVATDRVGGRV